MILNTGNRTDIPAFFSKWFMNRVREGYVLVRNPYFPSKVMKYEINPNVVDVLTFCTKNPKPMLKYIDELKDYKMFWFVTLTPYGKDIEPNVPKKSDVINSVKKLSEKLGKKCVSVRYDPIIFNENFDAKTHIKYFKYIISNLEGYIDKCTVSFLDLYEKTKRNAPCLKRPDYENQKIIGEAFAEIGRKHGVEIYSCHENEFLKDYGINIEGCMSQNVIEESTNLKLNVPSFTPKRDNCKCLLGSDIGEYNTCMHLCKYCYANYDVKTVMENFKKHDPNSPMLIGNLKEDDEVFISKQKSYKDLYKQVSLF